MIFTQGPREFSLNFTKYRKRGTFRRKDGIGHLVLDFQNEILNGCRDARHIDHGCSLEILQHGLAEDFCNISGIDKTGEPGERDLICLTLRCHSACNGRPGAPSNFPSRTINHKGSDSQG